MLVDSIKVYMKSIIAYKSQCSRYSPLEAELMTETSNIALYIFHDKIMINDKNHDFRYR